MENIEIAEWYKNPSTVKQRVQNCIFKCKFRVISVLLQHNDDHNQTAILIKYDSHSAKAGSIQIRMTLSGDGDNVGTDFNAFPFT